MVVGLRPETRVKGYHPGPVVLWAFSEIQGIVQGRAPDPRVPLEAFENVVALSDFQERRAGLAAFSATFARRRIAFDDKLAVAAKAQRAVALARLPSPSWFAGVSKGEILGELRGVTDMTGEREFFVLVAAGNRHVRCIFPELMRDEMNRLLFQPIRMKGFLHYDGSTPQPTLVEAVDIERLEENGIPHLDDLTGIFRDSYYPREPELPH